MIILAPTYWYQSSSPLKHLAGRACGVVVHGDAEEVELHRRNLTDWLDWMGLVAAVACAKLDRYIGCYGQCHISHDAHDADLAVQQEVGNVARSVVQAVEELRDGRLSQPDKQVVGGCEPAHKSGCETAF